MRATELVKAVLALGLFSGAVGTGVALERPGVAPAEGVQPVYLPPSALVRLASLGHEELAADYYWIRALLYYGDFANARTYYHDLHRYVNLVVDLDPDFEYAYRFGGVTIPYNPGRWRWQNLAEAERFLVRGVERFPDNWSLWMQLGFVRGTLGDDYAGAAEAYAHAAVAPDAPPWIPRLVTRLYATAGSLEAAKTYAEEVLANTDDPRLREIMRERLLEIRVEQDLVELDRRIAEYEKHFGTAPQQMQQLVDTGLLDGLPRDPLGGRYTIEDGEARSSSLHKGRLRAFRDHDE